MEEKKPRDFITEGVLAYGVTVGRFVFEEEGRIVYALSELMHIGPSDADMMFQISKDDHDRLLSLSCPDGIPVPEVSADITDSCKRGFLCGESAYGKRNAFTLADADSALSEEL